MRWYPGHAFRPRHEPLQVQPTPPCCLVAPSVHINCTHTHTHPCPHEPAPTHLQSHLPCLPSTHALQHVRKPAPDKHTCLTRCSTQVSTSIVYPLHQPTPLSSQHPKSYSMYTPSMWHALKACTPFPCTNDGTATERRLAQTKTALPHPALQKEHTIKEREKNA